MGGHGYDINIVSSFQRFWQFDAKQMIPCGNVMKLLMPALRPWSVPANGTVAEMQNVSLRARIATARAPLAPWTCELQKKSLVLFGNQQLFKYTVCCYPAFGGRAYISCCVKKETDPHNVRDDRHTTAIVNA